MLGVPVLRMDEDRLPLGPALEVVLGQRRPLVGSVRLVADQGDPPVVALLAQRLGRQGSGEAGADDDEGGVGGHTGLGSFC